MATAAREAHATTQSRGFHATDLALIAVFAALTAVLAIVPTVFSVGKVPFTFAVIAVVLTPLVLGSVRGGAAMALYVLAGLAGLPIFAKGAAGIGVLVGGTGGYLIGYIACGFVAGALATAVLRRRPSRALTPILLTVAAVIGVLVIHLFGDIWLMVGPTHLGLKAVLATTGTFLPWDLLKAVVAAVLAAPVLVAYPKLMPAPRGARN